MKGNISFDTNVAEAGEAVIEGCYKIDGGSWQVFYFTNWWREAPWQGDPLITYPGIWKSGITGVQVIYPKEKILNKRTAMEVLSKILGISDWFEVRGPDSLQLK
jgi:hypothetical protein